MILQSYRYCQNSLSILQDECFTYCRHGKMITIFHQHKNIISLAIIVLIQSILAIYLFSLLTKSLPKSNHLKTNSPPAPHDSQNTQNDQKSLRMYENLSLGYQFAYPDGFQIVPPTYNQIEIVPNSLRGKIVIRIVNKSVAGTVVGDDLTPDEIILLNRTKEDIEDSFTFITPKYSDQELQERFKQSLYSTNVRN